MGTDQDMTPSKLVELAFNRDAFVNTMWTLYLAVVAGVVTLMVAKNPLPSHHGFTKLALELIFLVFAALNLSAILTAGRQQQALLSMFKCEDREEFKKLIVGLRLPRLLFIEVHVIFDAAMICAIWSLPFCPRLL